MPKLNNLTGQKFGSLLVLERDYSKGTKTAYWKCQCDCGNITTKSSQGLIRGESVCCDRYKCPNRKPLGKNLLGQTFGRLTVIQRLEKRQWNSIVWKCQCECGNIVEVASASLTSGKTKSCGCLKEETDKMPKGNVIEMIGKKFGHLTVISRQGSDGRGEALWECECDCPAHTHLTVLGSNLRTGHTISCGCERRSKGELAVAQILYEHNIPFEQEKPMFQFSNKHYAKFDFYVDNKYLIEYDGETHYLSNLHGWHTQGQLQAQQERDVIKNQWCKENHIPLIRIPYTHLNKLCIEDLQLETSQFIV